jgi:enoyl-CoA hydratase
MTAMRDGDVRRIDSAPTLDDPRRPGPHGSPPESCMHDALVLVQRHPHWAEVVLNRPHRRNAFTADMAQQLAATVAALDADEDVQVILLRGEGGAFSSGIDLKEREQPGGPTFSDSWRQLHERLFATRTPVLGALERLAINAGAALALSCDLLVVGETAFLQVGEAAMGMTAPMNVGWLALRHGEAVAMQLTLSARRFPGPDLLRLGIALDCVPDERVAEHARELAGTLAGWPPGTLARIKAAHRRYVADDATTWFGRATG